MKTPDIEVTQVSVPLCIGGHFGRWLGHNFEGRWSSFEKPNQISEPFRNATHIDHETSVALVQRLILTDRKYEAEVCTRCGYVLLNQQQPTK